MSCLLIAALTAVASASYVVEVDYGNKIYVSKTTTTLQVVSNPILDREFHTPDGTIPNPIHDNAFASLAALEADFVRYVPWFPYPHVSVAELDPPVPGKPTSWDFTYITPQLEDFMDATHMRNHSTVINFSTQPCWLYNAPSCSYPANPDESDFAYVRGNKLLDPSARDLGLYYGRLLSWLMHGNFTDEHGVLHTGGPGYYNMTYWEVFNEAEHGYTQEWYTHDYDVVVNTIRAMADTTHRLKFVGIGGASTSWIPYFLNRSNHMDRNIPLDFVSVHFYASCSSRSDPATYASGFFGGADGFIASVINDIIPARDRTSPSTKLDFDELGVIMPDDNNPAFGIDAGLPDIYWNAAGAMYAYIFGRLVTVGVDVLGHSQLAGSPKIPEWGIPLPQYPSVSLLDWRTGYGNARYWVLKLLIENFGPGDGIYNTTVTGGSQPGPTNPFCGEVDGPDYSSTTLQCADPDAVISAIDFADWGTPSGTCGAYARSSCSEAKTQDYVNRLCVGKRTCVIAPYPALGDPCFDVVKRFVVQARCSTSHGGSATNATGSSVFALGFARPSGQRKVLLINKTLQPQNATIAGARVTAVHAVDPVSVTRSNPAGIRTLPGAAVLSLPPFAVWVADLA